MKKLMILVLFITFAFTGKKAADQSFAPDGGELPKAIKPFAQGTLMHLI